MNSGFNTGNYKSFGSGSNWSGGLDHLRGGGNTWKDTNLSVGGGVAYKINDSWSASGHTGHTTGAGMNYGVGFKYRF